MAAVLCAVAVLVLGACGTEVAGRAGAASPSNAASGFPWTTAQPSAVTGARLTDDRRTLILDTTVPSGAPACERDLKAVVTDSVPNTVWVQITFSSPASDRRSGCTKERAATTRVTLPGPLGDRKLIVDNDVTFTADGATPPALRLCGQLGCTPPATGCTAASYDQALIAVDAPAHTYRDAEDCRGRWLVLTFSWRTGPVCGEAEGSGCSSRLGDRWFFRAESSGWVPIAEGAAGGCQDVQRREPAFPTPMCGSLAPLSSSLHPSYPPSSASASPGAGSTATTAGGR
ncbi:hypothetical protein OG204_04765 [Streptomyces sp. NBC_01387]|uniref:hypothetical protein n=1 Tax=Streptomyces sp. NBC_01387 TaxID=2903849 RepID=UPI0032455A84